jgi:hypothetical protein
MGRMDGWKKLHDHDVLFNFLIKSLNLTTNPTIYSAHSWTIRFNTSNMVIKKGLSHWHHIQQ